MSILDNLESYLELQDVNHSGLSAKIFSETVCAECESKPMKITDNMGREVFWEDLGRPQG